MKKTSKIRAGNSSGKWSENSWRVVRWARSAIWAAEASRHCDIDTSTPRHLDSVDSRQLDNLFVRFFSASPIKLIVVRQGSTHHIQGTRRRNTTCSFLLPRTLLECGIPVAVSSKCVCGDAQQKMKALDRTRPRRETQKSAARGEGRRGSAGLDE